MKDRYVIEHKPVTGLKSYELKDYIEELRSKQSSEGLTFEELEYLEVAISERELRRRSKVYTPEKDRERDWDKEEENRKMNEKIKLIAENFIEWLVTNDYLEEREAEEDYSAIIDDVMEAYDVAPRLINLIGNICDN